jgi:drug/metabolite transporter (DMT)-like permease
MSLSLAHPLPSRGSPRPIKGQALLLAAALAFSSAGLFTREVSVDVWAMVFWRNLFGGIAVLPIVFAEPARSVVRSVGELGRWGWVMVAASSLATVCYLAAFAHTSVAHVSIIHATAPLLTAVIAWLWLGERPSRTTVGAAMLALVGVVVTVAGSRHGGMLGGDALAFTMAVCMSLMTALARRQARLPPMLSAWLCSLVAAAAVALIGGVSGAAFAVSWRQAAWLAAFGVVTMSVALPCYLAGARIVPAGQTMLISTAEMPLGPLWVWLVFAEVPSGASLLGGGAVAVAVLWQLSKTL